jgi:hypothetical protein
MPRRYSNENVYGAACGRIRLDPIRRCVNSSSMRCDLSHIRSGGPEPF